MATNKKIGDKGEQIVIDYFKKKGKKAIREKQGKGYDIRAGRLLIEVKGTEQTIEQKHFFPMSEKEFFTACKEKNYWLYWVDVKKKKIVRRVPRDEILANILPHPQYRLNLNEIKKRKMEV